MYKCLLAYAGKDRFVSKEGSFSYKWGGGFNTIYILFYFLLGNGYNKQYKYLYLKTSLGDKYLIPKFSHKSPPFWTIGPTD